LQPPIDTITHANQPTHTKTHVAERCALSIVYPTVEGDTIKVCITGAAGMLGRAVANCPPADINAVRLTRANGDLADPQTAHALLATHRPDTVIHCAAYTDVDGCTRDAQRAWQNNAQATRLLAAACAADKIRLVALSTEYVFSGTKNEPYEPDDEPAPINTYGQSKLAGERAVAENLADYLIVRTQWLFGPGGNNFVSAILDRAEAGDALKIIESEIGSPTYALDLAPALWMAVQSGLQGIVHITNSGICSRLELARYALQAADLSHVQIEPIAASEWPSPTKRPQRAVLSNSRWLQAGHPPLRSWEQAVADFVDIYIKHREG